MRTTGLERRVVEWWHHLGDLRGDAALYGASAVFAFLTHFVSATIAESHWGLLAAGPYALAALVSLSAWRRSVRRPALVRTGALILVLLGALVGPLILEAQWRSANPSGNYAQPEVMVIERAGAQLYANGDPYQAYWTHGVVVHQVANVPAYESFDPYLPLMGVFGLPSAALSHHSAWADARVIMTVTTGVVTALALWLLRLPTRRTLAILQWLVALPTGAMFLATGGDDIPLLALMLLAVAAVHRRKLGVAIGVVAVAAAMKLTAWPMVLGVATVAKATWGRRVEWLVLAGSGVVAAATIVPFVLRNPTTFVANVIKFPLGLAHVPSPAASPLPGHILSVLSKTLGHVALAATVVVGGVFLVRYVRRSWPLTVVSMLRLLTIASAVIIMMAPSTRSGYLIYPLNFWVWAVALTSSNGGGVLSDSEGPGHRRASAFVDGDAQHPIEGVTPGFLKQ